MARFDVHSHGGKGYLLDCQADVLSNFETRFVVPLLPAKGALSASRLHPLFDVRDQPHIMVTHLAAAVPIKELGPKVTSLTEEHHKIMNALDMLLTGC